MQTQQNITNLDHCEDTILKSKILIVDDEENVLSFLNDALKKNDFIIKLAKDSNEAIDLLNKNKFDLILSDINMPGMSGFELLTFCKEKYKTTEIVIITGNPGIEGAIKAIKHGAFDYITKPILPKKLNEIVDAALMHAKEKMHTLTMTSTDFCNKDYAAIKTLGSGNSGVVYLVEKNNKYYAMKILKIDTTDKSQEIKIQRFIREAEILSQIQHPNIVKIINVGLSETDKTPYIIMEFISGQSLDLLIKEKKFLLNEKIDIIIQIAKALKAIHDIGILHRDVKPANIILTDNNIIKLMDFGIAGLKSSNLTITNELLGSPAYMPPEAFDGAKLKDKRSDIFSLGVIAYELFTGMKPFNADSIGLLINDIKYINPNPPTQINKSLPKYIQTIILKMLAKDINDRFSDSEEVINAFKFKKNI